MNEQFEKGNMQFVGLAGTLNAGKDTGAEHLASEHGYLHVSTGDLLRGEAARRGLGDDRNTLIDLGIQLRADYGSQGALIIKATELWQDDSDRYPGGLVVTGMRAIGEAREVLARAGMLLFVDAQLETRYRRMVARQRDSESSQTLKQFTTHSLMEEYGDPQDNTRPNLGAIRKLSHKVLYNDGYRPDAFLKELDHTLGLSH